MKRTVVLSVVLLVVALAGGVAYVTLVRPGVWAPSPAPVHVAAAPAPVPAPAPAPAPAVTAAPSPPADCLLPGPPPVPPNGETASEADMKLGHDAIQGFVLELEGYQKCRDMQADRAAPGVTQKQKQSWIEQGDEAVDEANALASAFGAQLKAYKARMGNGGAAR